MSRVVEVSHGYPGLSAERLWLLVSDYSALAQVCRGFVSFDGLPEGRCFEGQRFDLNVRVFGVFPPQDYHMHILTMDEDMRVIQSSERGAGAKAWAHRIWVEETADGAVLHDRIEIDAGWLTWAFVLYARAFYARRHRRRVKLIAEGLL